MVISYEIYETRRRILYVYYVIVVFSHYRNARTVRVEVGKRVTNVMGGVGLSVIIVTDRGDET